MLWSFIGGKIWKDKVSKENYQERQTLFVSILRNKVAKHDYIMKSKAIYNEKYWI